MKRSIIFMFSLCIVLLSGCKNLMQDYDLDTRSDYWEDITLLDYISLGKDPQITLYAEAVRYAGAENLLDGPLKTRIVPNNEAMEGMLLSAGVANIQELSPNVVKEMLSYLVIPGTYRSLDLEEDETVGEVTARGDSLYLTRSVTATDKYRLSVNNHPKLATSQIAVLSQDYVFSDGIAHIVDGFPVYQEKTKPTDAAPDGVDYSDAEQHTIWVNNDTHVINATASHRETNYGSETLLTVANAAWTRYGFLLFDLDPIEFVDDLTRANLNIYYAQRSIATLDPVLGVFETGSNWEEMTLTWNSMPDFGAQINSSSLVLGQWNEIDITGSINRAYQNGLDKVSLGLRLLAAPNGITGTVSLRSKEQGDGSYAASIKLFGAIPSELEVDYVSGLQVSQQGAKVIEPQNLSMKASGSAVYNYTDNNIIYVLMDVPTNGTVTRYGLPIRKFSEFTQEELKKGAIRYVHNGGSSSDVMTFKVKDYIGGVYTDIIGLPVTIQ
ncbi:DNRLRE domain-containing protein [Sphingobacterium chuzhouense]|uniref:DNRLRE domain-containing protein n=1 Tax=Sphingobacterium chuzhouense TaxID=1742264 RepID=A0ABR7XUS0_9SPHI|nr:DNRLRE domain-containing protein [Sphingobacterium chuzhouense]MBD1422809.1 DNRLRE domain-containing protein [Sphingobacterium chuzhouense]